MIRTLVQAGVFFGMLFSAHAAPPPVRQPAITADDLSWFSGIQYVKGSFDGAGPERPQALRLILQRKGIVEVELVPEIPIRTEDHWKEFPTEFIFISAKQPDDKLKLFVGLSNFSGRVTSSKVTDAFKECRVICVKYLEDYKLTKGRHVLLYGDGGEGATDPNSDDYSVRVVVEVK